MDGVAALTSVSPFSGLVYIVYRVATPNEICFAELAGVSPHTPLNSLLYLHDTSVTFVSVYRYQSGHCTQAGRNDLHTIS